MSALMLAMTALGAVLGILGVWLIPVHRRDRTVTRRFSGATYASFPVSLADIPVMRDATNIKTILVHARGHAQANPTVVTDPDWPGVHDAIDAAGRHARRPGSHWLRLGVLADAYEDGGRRRFMQARYLLGALVGLTGLPARTRTVLVRPAALVHPVRVALGPCRPTASPEVVVARLPGWFAAALTAGDNPRAATHLPRGARDGDGPTIATALSLWDDSHGQGPFATFAAAWAAAVVIAPPAA